MIIVINGLGVVVGGNGKRRMILDARYINLFDKYDSSSYEQLSDVVHLIYNMYYILVVSYVREGDSISKLHFPD